MIVLWPLAEDVVNQAKIISVIVTWTRRLYTAEITGPYRMNQLLHISPTFSQLKVLVLLNSRQNTVISINCEYK